MLRIAFATVSPKNNRFVVNCFSGRDVYTSRRVYTFQEAEKVASQLAMIDTREYMLYPR